MASITWLEADRLKNRLDAVYYHPSFLSNEDRLLQSNVDILPLKVFVKEGRRAIYFSTQTLEAEEADNTWVPFLTADDFGADGFFIDLNSRRRVSPEFADKYPKGELRENEILVKVKGPNQVTAYNSNEPSKRVLVSGTIWGALVRIEKIDPQYLVTALSCPYAAIARSRLRTNTNVEFLAPDDLLNLELPIPDAKVQAYIGNKVRLAERLRERSQKVWLELRDKMQKCFRGKPKPPQNKFSKVPSNKLTGNRLESEFYTPLVLWADEEIKGTPWKYQPLSQLTHRIKDGPGGWGVSTGDYVNYGIPVVRAVNLIDGECDLSDCVFISPKKHKELIRHRAAKGSVLLSVRGTIGRAAVFESEDFEEASLNAAVVTIDCKDEILPHYLAEFLNTEIGKIQSNRIANGAVQLNMNLTETGSNLIVVAPKDFQEEISTLRQQRLLFKALSYKLIIAAKLLVEALIEGKLSEADLKAAQEGLEQGDSTLDRAILARLTRKGIDYSNEPPLFPDLDALYTALANLDANQDLDTADSGNGQAAKVYPLTRSSIPLASEATLDAYASTEEVPG
ncbi:hypothetical protein [Lyngbya confervoides]|uniref:Type I restriction modification DNA specificity domain-containing protein n=1 Tax=Lyngbya confervoides BDU141951 TaxID=1574623 RepID=A0ABD4T914_9CYAN|nr:hypothetical protein [Lyngbya confervoides]MCM1984760.1 hypothetical protein [Lyngbya confervoides BDU141951]